MGRLVRYEACPRCRARGADRRGDNLGVYADGSVHCFSCGYHTFPKGVVPTRQVKEENEEGVLPRDFTREIPTSGWKWLLQYGLPYSYWKPFTGFSPATDRLVITHGNPIETSVGRYVGPDAGERVGEPAFRKWRQWGDKLRSATVLEPTNPSKDERVVVVEDIISAHVVRSAGSFSIPAFGTTLYPKLIASLRALKRPTSLWLDLDQWGVLPPKLNRLQTFLDVPVEFVNTRRDPKKHTLEEVREILNERM